MELYIHIPFCRKKCRYCSFVSFAGREAEAERYIGLVLKEARNRKNEFTEEIHTMFIGGGTPSILPADQLLRLSEGLRALLALGSLQEFTIESNPGTVTDLWLDAAVQTGMNRLSIGMQAYQPGLLDILGRIHTYQDVERTVLAAREHGIQNISLDLIFGIPGQTLSQWMETLEAADALHPEHISAYGLIPEEGTPLERDLSEGLLSLPDPDMEREMYDAAINFLAEKGYGQYEISNFARPGCRCRHNAGYWQQIPYVGLGLSAASMSVLHSGRDGMLCRRIKNPELPAEYEAMVLQHTPPAEDTLISPSEACFETLMLGLRMNDGVDESRFESLHGITIEEKYGRRLRELEARGLLIHAGGFWKMTRRGFDIQNSILVELMED